MAAEFKNITAGIVVRGPVAGASHKAQILLDWVPRTCYKYSKSGSWKAFSVLLPPVGQVGTVVSLNHGHWASHVARTQVHDSSLWMCSLNASPENRTMGLNWALPNGTVCSRKVLKSSNAEAADHRW